MSNTQSQIEQNLASASQSIKELVEAQKRTEQRVEELVEAQRKTQTVLDSLLKDVDEIKEQLGGIAMVVGYGLEDKLYPYIPQYALKEKCTTLRSLSIGLGTMLNTITTNQMR